MNPNIEGMHFVESNRTKHKGIDKLADERASVNPNPKLVAHRKLFLKVAKYPYVEKLADKIGAHTARSYLRKKPENSGKRLMGKIFGLRDEGERHLHQNRRGNKRKETEPDGSFGSLLTVPFIEQIRRHVDGRINRIAERHHNGECADGHLNRFCHLNICDNRRKADPGVQPLFAKHPKTQQK